MDTDDFKLVIGLVGLKAAGKDEFGKFAVDHFGFTQMRISDAIRAEALHLGIPDPTTAQLQEIGNRGCAESGDSGYWARVLLGLARENGKKLVVVNGVRRPLEVSALSEAASSNFVAVGIVAPLLSRWERFRGRGQAGDPQEFKKFLALDDRDRGIGEPPHGQQVDRTLSLVPWENIYNNKGTREEYWNWINSFMEKHLA